MFKTVKCVLLSGDCKAEVNSTSMVNCKVLAKKMAKKRPPFGSL